jgi:AbrB family looped-hinge helix DNA binding protein
MIEISMTVGPKGQVVIPQVLREAFKIPPGSKVVFKVENDRLIIEPVCKDVVSIFRRTARAAGKKIKLKPHESYEEELKERLR